MAHPVQTPIVPPVQVISTRDLLLTGRIDQWWFRRVLTWVFIPIAIITIVYDWLCFVGIFHISIANLPLTQPPSDFNPELITHFNQIIIPLHYNIIDTKLVTYTRTVNNGLPHCANMRWLIGWRPRDYCIKMFYFSAPVRFMFFQVLPLENRMILTTRLIDKAHFRRMSVVLQPLLLFYNMWYLALTSILVLKLNKIGAGIIQRSRITKFESSLSKLPTVVFSLEA